MYAQSKHGHHTTPMEPYLDPPTAAMANREDDVREASGAHLEITEPARSDMAGPASSATTKPRTAVPAAEVIPPLYFMAWPSLTLLSCTLSVLNAAMEQGCTAYSMPGCQKRRNRNAARYLLSVQRNAGTAYVSIMCETDVLDIYTSCRLSLSLSVCPSSSLPALYLFHPLSAYRGLQKRPGPADEARLCALMVGGGVSLLLRVSFLRYHIITFDHASRRRR